MNNCFIRLVFAIAILWWPVNIMGETKHCGTNKLPYDPSKQGCCLHEDGTGEVTDNPENVDPHTSSVFQDHCKGAYDVCDKYGITICYNGKKVAVVCNCMSIQNTDLLACIQAHEDAHVRDNNLKCTDCDTKNPQPQDQAAADQAHCDLYRADINCATNIPGWKDIQEIRAYVQNATALLRWNNCP